MILFKIIYKNECSQKVNVSMTIGVLEHKVLMPIYDRDIENVEHTQKLINLLFHFKYFRIADNFWNREPEIKDKSENGKDKIYLCQFTLSKNMYIL